MVMTKPANVVELGMLRLRQEIPTLDSNSTSVPAGSRFWLATTCGVARCHAYSDSLEEPPAQPLALRGSIAERYGGFARRGHDGFGACGAAGTHQSFVDGGRKIVQKGGS